MDGVEEEVWEGGGDDDDDGGKCCGGCECFCLVIVLECINTEQKDVDDRRYCCVVRATSQEGVESSGA
jgi:hypothetical protein